MVSWLMLTHEGEFTRAPAVGTALSILVLVNTLQEAIDEIHLLSILVLIQRADAKYSSYDLSNAADLLAYLFEILSGLQEGQETETFNRAVQQLLETKPELHGIVREHLEGLHNIIVQGPSQDPVETSHAILRTLRNLLGHLAEAAGKDQGIAAGLKDRGSDGQDTYGVVG